jgi:hypothetical protein
MWPRNIRNAPLARSLPGKQSAVRIWAPRQSSPDQNAGGHSGRQAGGRATDYTLDRPQCELPVYRPVLAARWAAATPLVGGLVLQLYHPRRRRPLRFAPPTARRSKAGMASSNRSRSRRRSASVFAISIVPPIWRFQQAQLLRHGLLCLQPLDPSRPAMSAPLVLQ